jgi:hypothetical protein
MAFRGTKSEIEAELEKVGVVDAKCKQLVNVITGKRTCIAYESVQKCMYWMFQRAEGDVYELVDQGSMF